MTFTLPRRSLLLAAAGSAAATFAPALRAQAWPNRPLRFVVPFAPGGSSEIIARATAGELTKTTSRAAPATWRCRRWRGPMTSTR
jgi:tripartite-type tricarboxylate transporter receptor subunit TctC